MPQELNKALLSEATILSDIKSISLIEAYFEVFTKRLVEYNVVEFTQSSQYSGGSSRGRILILGYSFNTSMSDDFDPESESIPGRLDYDWNYVLFTGKFYKESEVINVLKSDKDLCQNSTSRFLSNAVRGRFIDDTIGADELQRELKELHDKGRLNSVKIVFISDGILKEKSDSNIEVKGFSEPIKIEYWDLEKLNDLSKLKSKRVPINIDLNETKYSYAELPALQKIVNSDVTSYLSIFPGAFIADLYDQYHTRLLENNVRVFLSLRRKHNAGMAKSIEREAELFFSYNNGLSVTASEIEISDGKIISLTDLQIVNGGQTTATLSYARKKRKLDLSKVFVQVKLTRISNHEIYSDYVSDISKYSNSQTSIRKSDFFTNDSYLIELEKKSQELSANVNGVISYYFFERMSGQYNETKNKQGTKTREKQWEKKYPKIGSFNKIDFARWSNVMLLKPYLAAAGAEKQFESYMKTDSKPALTNHYVKTLIGFGSLFDRARKVCGRKGGRDFPPIIDDPSVGMSATIYGMAFLHYFTGGKFDYHVVFDKIFEENEFDEILKGCIKSVWIPMTEFGGVSVQEQSKKSGCWDLVKQNSILSESLIQDINSHCISDQVYKERNRQDLNNSIDYSYFKLLDEVFTVDNMLLSKMNLTAKNFNKQYLPFIEELCLCLEQRDHVIRRTALEKIVEFKTTMRLFKDLKGNSFENIEEELNQLTLEDAQTFGEKLIRQGGLSSSDFEYLGITI
jgi:hypothetical protein